MNTFKDLIDIIEGVKHLCPDINFIPHPILKGQQCIIIIGNKRYYSPDLRFGEITYYKLPELNFDVDAPFECVINYLKSID